MSANNPTAPKERTSDIVSRVRAVACLARSRWGTPENEMFAFLSIFHPEIPLQRRIRMCRDAQVKK